MYKIDKIERERERDSNKMIREQTIPFVTELRN